MSLLPPCVGSMKLTIRTIAGSHLFATLEDIKPTDTILSLKEKIRDIRKDIFAAEQELMFNGNTLENNKTVESYGITGEQTIILQRKLCSNKELLLTRLHNTNIEISIPQDESFFSNVGQLKDLLRYHTSSSINSLYIFEQQLRNDAAINKHILKDSISFPISINQPQIIGFHQPLPEMLLKLVEKPLFLLCDSSAHSWVYFAVTEQFCKQLNIHTFGNLKEVLNKEFKLSENKEIKALYLLDDKLNDDLALNTDTWKPLTTKQPPNETWNRYDNWKNIDKVAFEGGAFPIFTNLPPNQGWGIRYSLPNEILRLLGRTLKSDMIPQETKQTSPPSPKKPPISNDKDQNKQGIIPCALIATGIVLTAYGTYRWLKTSKKNSLSKADFEKLVDQAVALLQEENEVAIAKLLSPYNKENQKRIRDAAEARLMLFSSS